MFSIIWRTGDTVNSLPAATYVRPAKENDGLFVRSSHKARGVRRRPARRGHSWPAPSMGLDLASWLETDSVHQVISALEKKEPGRRPMCIAIATTHVASANIDWLLEFLDHFRSPFIIGFYLPPSVFRLDGGAPLNGQTMRLHLVRSRKSSVRRTDAAPSD